MLDNQGIAVLAARDQAMGAALSAVADYSKVWCAAMNTCVWVGVQA